MSAYQYVALKQTGQTIKGVIQADSLRHARQLIREKQLIPTQVSPLKKELKNTAKGRLSTKDLALFTRQLATLLAAGIPIEEALQGVGEQSEKEITKRLVIGVRAKVTEGYALAHALGEFPKAFPELYRATIAAGEQTGRLDKVLERLADYVEHQQRIKQKIQQALIYPALMITMSTAIIGFLLAFVVPKIIDVFTSSGQTLPIMTRILMQVSHLIQADGLYILIILLLGSIIFLHSLKKPTFRNKLDQILLKLPFISYFIRTTQIARYIHTFSILFGSGVNILETLRVATQVVTNNTMRESLNAAAIQIKEGRPVHAALKDSQWLTPMSIHLITSGEKSGQLAAMMERAAQHLDEEIKRLIETGLTLLEPLVILIMGAMVLFIVLATLLPIFSMEQLVT